MGVRTAASKLGFRLAAFNLLFSRRSFASLEATTEILEKEKIPNLFLCFDERKQSDDKLDTNIVFRPIRLDSYDDRNEVTLLDTETHRFPVYKDIVEIKYDSDKYFRRDTDGEKEKLRKDYSLACQTKSIRLGSNILFTVGQTTPRDICWVDPSIHPVKFHVSSQTETKIKSFCKPKIDMRWGVIDGKLYCIDSYDHCQPYFQVLDPETDDTSWQGLSDPPFIDGDKYSVLFLNESRKILGWEDARKGVYCFDATKPENGWMESGRSFGDAVSLISQNDVRLVVRDNHHDLGDFNLMFSYDRFDEPFVISPFLISDKCDSFKCIRNSIRLPKQLCSEYRVRHWYAYKSQSRKQPHERCDSQLVHLGSNKFCLILHKYDVDKRNYRKRIRGGILVLTFEYDVSVSRGETKDSEAPLEIKTRRLGTRRFRYYLKNEELGQNDMIGAFSF